MHAELTKFFIGPLLTWKRRVETPNEGDKSKCRTKDKGNVNVVDERVNNTMDLNLQTQREASIGARHDNIQK
jgi:hypothetical protein